MEDKKGFAIFVLLGVILALNLVILFENVTSDDLTAKISQVKSQTCATIPEGGLIASDGSEIFPGYNQWGYNYQADMFNGMYCDYHPIYREGGSQHDACMASYGNDTLIMKWNDAWLSNKDCDNDGLLDRHYGLPSYRGSGAWLTNHQRGSYQDDGEDCAWTYFVKIVAAPLDAIKQGTMWVLADGTELGEIIWGDFAVIQSIYNDTCTGEHGVEYLSPAGPGFGKF